MKLAFALMAAINAGFTKTEARRASWRPRSDSRFSLADSESGTAAIRPAWATLRKSRRRCLRPSTRGRLGGRSLSDAAPARRNWLTPANGATASAMWQPHLIPGHPPGRIVHPREIGDTDPSATAAGYLADRRYRSVSRASSSALSFSCAAAGRTWRVELRPIRRSAVARGIAPGPLGSWWSGGLARRRRRRRSRARSRCSGRSSPLGRPG
jgi:hypothetical protein